MIGKTVVKTEGRHQLRIYLVVFRWLAVFLGLWLTSFGNSKPINPLPQFLADIPVVITLLILMYHAVASFVALRYDESIIIVALLIAMDAIAGGFMSFYFGMPYFFAAVLLPTLLATFYFDILIAMVVALFCTIFYGSVIALPLIRTLQGDPLKKIKLSNIFSQLSIYVVSSVAIFLAFRWFLKQQDEVRNIVRKFQEEKNMLFESHQSTKKEFGAVFAELEKKQELIDALERSAERAQEEKEEAIKTLENTQHNLEKLRKAAVEAENKAKKYQAQLKKVREKELLQLQEEYEKLIIEKEEIIEAREDMIRELEKKVASTTGEQASRIEDLQQKISLLVGKINQLNSALQARENLFESYSRISENIKLKNVVTAILNEALKLVKSQTGLLFLLEQTSEGPVYSVHASHTPYKSLFKDYTVVPGEGPVGWVGRKKRPLRIIDGDVKLRSGEEISTLLKYEKSALVVPILHKKEAIGVIYLGRPGEKAYVNKELYLLNSFCKLAGPTIQTSKTYERSAGVSLKDRTTALYNKTYFSERLQEETARSLRYNIPLCLAIMEIVNYARFAEKSEKVVQDKLVRDLSDILRENIRETDLAARLEDNVFAIIFMHADKNDVVMVTERIRMSAEMRSFGSSEAKKAGLHLFVGISSVSKEVNNSDKLYNYARENLESARKKKRRETAPLGRAGIKEDRTGDKTTALPDLDSLGDLGDSKGKSTSFLPDLDF